MARLTRDDWLAGAFELLAAGSITDVRVEPLARRLGVTKGSFYHHFGGRPELLDALLDLWVLTDTERIIEFIGESADPDTDPAAALHSLAELIIGTVTSLDGVEQAVREWAASDPDVADRCSAIDEQRLAYVEGLLVSAGVDTSLARGRSELFYRVVIGEFTWRRYGGAPLDLTPVRMLVDAMLGP